MDPQQQQQAAAQAIAGMGAFFAVFAVFGILMVVAMVFLFWRIFTKAGLAGPLSLLVLVPGIGPLVVVCILAFGTWKVVPAPQQYISGGYPPQPPLGGGYPPQQYPPSNYPPNS